MIYHVHPLFYAIIHIQIKRYDNTTKTPATEQRQFKRIREKKAMELFKQFDESVFEGQVQTIHYIYTPLYTYMDTLYRYYPFIVFIYVQT